MGKQTEKKTARRSGRLNKQIGNNFERLIAKDLQEVYGLDKTHIFRTPQSGGHPSMRANDLMLSDVARKVFPFSIECKTLRSWRITEAIDFTKTMASWTRQCLTAIPKDLCPALVMRGSSGGIYFAARESDLKAQGFLFRRPVPHIIFRNLEDDRAVWVAIPWKAWLRQCQKKQTV